MQLFDPQRITRTLNKQRVKFHLYHIYCPKIHVYDSNKELLNKESMVALIGINNYLQKVPQELERHKDYYGRRFRLKGNIADLFLIFPRDAFGIHWYRIFAEEQTN